jgi:hypothetical protein
MSKESFEKLKRIVQENSDIIDVGNSASDDIISSAERYLNISFPEDYKLFLKMWGTLAIGPREYYGIAGSDFKNSSVPNGIWFTLKKREQLDLPKNLIIICDNDGVEYLCIDIDRKDGPSVVVTWNVPSRELLYVKSTDLFDFIIEDSEDFL